MFPETWCLSPFFRTFFLPQKALRRLFCYLLAMKTVTASVLALMSTACLAAPPAGTEFTHHDWELVCDNTRTCRAAGYQSDETDPASAVSVLLEREAGPGRPVKAQVRLGGDPEKPIPKGGAVTMRIDGRSHGQVRIDRKDMTGTLTPAQTQALVSAVAGTGAVSWTDGDITWPLSGKGASAVLLKMDEFQGRLGTTGALLRKGARAEDGVPGPLPMPEVAAAPAGATDVGLPPAERTALLAALRKALDGCDAFAPDQLSVMRLNADKLLVQIPCWQGAYNEGYAFVLANKKAPFQLEPITDSGSDYAAGTITASQKGRGIGDCWSRQEWVWDGRRFVLTEKATTGMCKSVAPGGAWHLPSYVAKVTRGPR
jgi:invasion protein IalB